MGSGMASNGSHSMQVDIMFNTPMQNYNKFYGSHSFFLSGSNDHTTKFWCRNRPGDPVKDKLGSYLQGCLFQGSYTLSQMLHSCP